MNLSSAAPLQRRLAMPIVATLVLTGASAFTLIDDFRLADGAERAGVSRPR